MNITIKDIPSRLHRKLKARASANKRSLNWEVIDILESTLEGRPVKIQELFKEIDSINARIKVTPPTEEFLFQAKNEGRR